MVYKTYLKMMKKKEKREINTRGKKEMMKNIL